MGDPADVKFLRNARAMEILEELERGSNSESEEDDEALGSVNTEGGKSSVGEDGVDGKGETAPGPGCSQNGKEKVVRQKQESVDPPPSKS